MKTNLLKLMLVGITTLTLASCGEKPQPSPSDSSSTVDEFAGLTGTELAVAKASKMTITELEQASKAEMEASSDTFKVLGLTSALAKASAQLAEKYDWLRAADAEDGSTKANMFVKNDYKDYTLLTALEPASDTYVADYALVQDARCIADYAAEGILYNYVPSDAASFGLDADGTEPLQGIHFNKVFWTNTNFEKVNNGLKLYNIWQMAGAETDKDHISKVSFQSPVTEQINMSFLLSVQAPSNQARIEKAYKSFYGTDWSSTKYANAGEQWVTEFIANISRFHSSDGTAMKETQLKNDWNEGYVYYGAFSKMKDAAGKTYDVDLDGNGTIEDSEKKINAMTTVKWDWEIEGFQGYFYTMFSQIVNNAKHPYTACLFARYMLEPDFYTKTIYSNKTPNADGTDGNQYGYYYPGKMDAYGTAGAKVTTNSYDWSKADMKAKSILEDYSYLGNVKSAKVASVSSLIQANTKAK